MFIVKHPVKSRIQVKTFTLPELCMFGAHLFLHPHSSNSQRPHTVCCVMCSMSNCFLGLSAGCDSTSHAKRVRSKATIIGPFMWERATKLLRANQTALSPPKYYAPTTKHRLESFKGNLTTESTNQYMEPTVTILLHRMFCYRGTARRRAAGNVAAWRPLCSAETCWTAR